MKKYSTANLIATDVDGEYEVGEFVEAGEFENIEAFRSHLMNIHNDVIWNQDGLAVRNLNGRQVMELGMFTKIYFAVDEEEISN